MPATLAPTPAHAVTPDDLLRMPDRGKGYELVADRLVELNVSQLSSYVASRVYLRLTVHVETGRLGWVFPEGTSYRCFPDAPRQVGRADTAFHALDRLTPDRVSAEGHGTVVPDLVVEVISPNDLSKDVEGKQTEWLTAGARLVWVVQPETRTVHAYAADDTVRLFGPADELTAAPVLADFRTPVADLFALPAGAAT